MHLESNEHSWCSRLLTTSFKELEANLINLKRWRYVIIPKIIISVLMATKLLDIVLSKTHTKSRNCNTIFDIANNKHPINYLFKIFPGHSARTHLGIIKSQSITFNNMNEDTRNREFPCVRWKTPKRTLIIINLVIVITLDRKMIFKSASAINCGTH